MTHRFFACWFACLLAPALLGAPLKFDSLKAGSTTYQNVTIIGRNETDLYFTHAGGIANVKLRDLDAKLQREFDYDPKAAAAFERQQLKDDAAYQTSVVRTMAEQAQKAVTAAAESAAAPEDRIADPLSDRSPLNKPAPKIAPAKWLGETPGTEGKTVLVFFWATWSAPCRAVIPQLNEWQKKFGDQLAVIGISAEPEPAVASFANPRIEFFSAVDPDSKLANLMGVTSVPQVLLIDPKCIVRYLGHPAALDPAKFERRFAQPGE